MRRNLLLVLVGLGLLLMAFPLSAAGETTTTVAEEGATTTVADEETATTAAEDETTGPAVQPAVVAEEPPTTTPQPDWTYRYLIPTGLLIAAVIVIVTVVQYFVQVVRKRYRVVR